MKKKGRPVGVIAISSVLLIEALMLAGSGGLVVKDAVGAGAASPSFTAGRSVLLSGWFFICAAFLAILGHYFFRGRRWTRSPILVWQLLGAAVSCSGVLTEIWAPVALSGAAIILLVLFTKPITRFLSPTDSP